MSKHLLVVLILIAPLRILYLKAKCLLVYITQHLLKLLFYLRYKINYFSPCCDWKDSPTKLKYTGYHFYQITLSFMSCPYAHALNEGFNRSQQLFISFFFCSGVYFTCFMLIGIDIIKTQSLDRKRCCDKGC